MKKIINQLFLFSLTVIFASSGYFIGSSRQKVVIKLAAEENDLTVNQAAPAAKPLNILPQVQDKTADLPVESAAPAASVPVQPKKAPVQVQTNKAKIEPRPAPAVSPAPEAAPEAVPAPSPEPASAPEPAPAPQTNVS